MTEAVKVKEGMMPLAKALNTMIELHDKCLQRGLFQNAQENMRHIDALSTLEEYIKEMVVDHGLAELVPTPVAEEVAMIEGDGEG